MLPTFKSQRPGYLEIEDALAECVRGNVAFVRTAFQWANNANKKLSYKRMVEWNKEKEDVKFVKSEVTGTNVVADTLSSLGKLVRSVGSADKPTSSSPPTMVIEEVKNEGDTDDEVLGVSTGAYAWSKRTMG